MTPPQSPLTVMLGLDEHNPLPFAHFDPFFSINDSSFLILFLCFRFSKQIKQYLLLCLANGLFPQILHKPLEILAFCHLSCLDFSMMDILLQKKSVVKPHIMIFFLFGALQTIFNSVVCSPTSQILPHTGMGGAVERCP